MKKQSEIIVPDNIATNLRDGVIVHSETGSYTVLPPATIITAERVFGKIGVDSIEQIAPDITDGVPIFKLNEAPTKAKCHRQACHWAPPPTPLNDPPREAFGKGMTAQQSKASAMMEAVERYCGQCFSHNIIIEADYDSVARYAINPSEFIFPTLPTKCQSCGDRNLGCFQELEPVAGEWSWGYSLIRKIPILVPAAMVYYPYISGTGLSFVFNDTGGLSAGNTIEEAILQGIAEVIERDSLYYTFNTDHLKNMPLIDFTNTGNAHINKFMAEVLPPESIFAFQIQNEALDLNIASVAAFICYQMEDGRNRYFGGSGTSLNPEIALLRALTEVEQQKVRQKALQAFDRNRLVRHPPLKQGNVTNLADLPVQMTGNIRKDIELYLDRMAGIGTDVIVVNLTHPDIGIPVVRILTPKLIVYSGCDIEESHLLDAMRACGGQV